MNPKFFLYKFREVRSFLQIMRGKLSGNRQDRIKGVDHALESMEKEKKIYQEEKENAQKETNRDISAI